ncbi:nitroreductase family protein [bacterium]|nr:nitroreductase family protein [bacterium]
MISDCILAAENLMLAAYGKGLGTCWIEWTKQSAQDKELMAELGISDEYEMMACIALGYPDESPEMPERKSPHVLKWIK